MLNIEIVSKDNQNLFIVVSCCKKYYSSQYFVTNLIFIPYMIQYNTNKHLFSALHIYVICLVLISYNKHININTPFH